LMYFLSEKNKMLLIPAGIFAGLAVMSKGTMGLWAPFIMFLYTIFTKQFKKLISIDIILIAIPFLIVVLPWHIIMYNKFGMDFINTYFWNYQLSYFGNSSGNVNPWGTFDNIKKVFENYWPWIVFLFYGFYRSFIDLKNKNLNTFNRRWIILNIIWIFSIFIIFQFSTVKRYYFTLPAYTAMGFLSGYYFIKFKKYQLIKNIFLILSLIFSITLYFGKPAYYLDQPGKDWQNHKNLLNYINNNYKDSKIKLYIFPRLFKLNQWTYSGFVAHTRLNVINGLNTKNISKFITNKKKELVFTYTKYYKKFTLDKWRKYLKYEKDNKLLFEF